MTDPTRPQTVKIQHYGTVPAKQPKEKRVFLQSLRKPKPATQSPNKLLEIGGNPRRGRRSSMNFPREIIRGVYQLTQTINGYTIDSSIFRLNTNATVILLITFSLAVTTRQYVGHAIDCLHARDIPEEVLNTYCWIHSTFTVVQEASKRHQQNDQLSLSGIETTGKRAIRQIKYYQWVEFFLFLQAILFYTPRWLWKSWEGGKIHALMMDLDVAVCTEIEKKQKKKLMIDYLWENLRYHNWWAYKYYFCEILSLINVIGQMFLMNRFFDGAFLMFGFEVLSFINSDQEDRIDPMIQVFPRMTKCTFQKYGVSGEQEKHDALCILPLNVVNEKIYIFLWFWFIILTILTFLTVVYRIIIIFSPRMRVYLLRMRYRLVRGDVIDTIVRRSKMGDWFLFYMLGENVDSLIFRDVLQELAHKLNRHDFHHGPGFKGEIQEA
ncbi:innexin shaking-B isoform X1 [Diabrotica undecimpunctata]|uniref:innexin shaking-B isoform X1 n=1 Tax=Diabrotica undecimpunctata TaxID=50387 RepID=UPI003B63DC49